MDLHLFAISTFFIPESSTFKLGQMATHAITLCLSLFTPRHGTGRFNFTFLSAYIDDFLDIFFSLQDLLISLDYLRSNIQELGIRRWPLAELYTPFGINPSVYLGHPWQWQPSQ
ncbi:MAG: hypothetical protein V7772_16685 [Pseudomonas profundi]